MTFFLPLLPDTINEPCNLWPGQIELLQGPPRWIYITHGRIGTTGHYFFHNSVCKWMERARWLHRHVKKRQARLRDPASWLPLTSRLSSRNLAPVLLWHVSREIYAHHKFAAGNDHKITSNRFLLGLSGAVVLYHYFCLIDGIACGSTK